MATEQIDSFDDLLGLLERNPEYRARLRQLILDEEFQQLPAQVQLLIQTVQSHTALLQSLATSLEGHGRLLENHSRTLEIHSRLLESQTRTLNRHEKHLSRLIGDEAERRFQQNAAAYFGGMMRRIRVTDRFVLADMLDDAVDSGRLTEGDQRSLLALDLAIQGLDRNTRRPARMAVEVSSGIGERDIMRAVDRARLLEKLTGDPTMPVVAGYSIAPAYRQLAEDKGVEVTTVAPPDAGEPEPDDELNMTAVDVG